MIKWVRNHYLLNNGALFSYLRLVPESVVLTGQGRIKLYNWKGLLQIWLTYKKISLPPRQPYLVVHNSYSGYYHWLLESLPKLMEAKRTIPAFTLLLPVAYQDDFYADTLRLLGVANVERLHSRTMYRVPELALPYVSDTMGNYSPEALRELKSALLNGLTTKKVPENGHRLYISRRKASRRRVLNEPQVVELLVQYGFQSICFEDYTFAEQLLLCAQSTHLIGIHGAGLSNMLFMPESSTVIEFRQFDNGENYFFTQLAHTLCHTYHLLYCTALNAQQSVQDADIEVDIPALKALLEVQGMAEEQLGKP